MKTYIIIGASAAGISCAHTLRRLDGQGRIIMIAQESEWPYNKCLLADYLAGEKTAEDLQLLTQQQVADKNIELMLGKTVISVASGRKMVTLHDGTTVQYDALFMGTGARAVVPAVPGNQVPGVYTFQTMQDTQKLLQSIARHEVRRAVVVGAGLTGLECADALQRQGIQVSVVERAERVLYNQVDRIGAELIEKYAQAVGVSLYTNDSVAEIIGDEHGVRRVELASGGELDADMVIWAIGVTPNIKLAQDAGIDVYDRGIETNEYMQTSVPDIYAGGDVAMITDLLTDKKVLSATWPDAMMQGGIAAHAMAGVPKKYAGALVITSSAFFGIKFATCGPVAHAPYAWEVVRKSSVVSSNLYLLDQENKVRGFSLVGNVQQLGALKRAILTKMPIDRASLME